MELVVVVVLVAVEKEQHAVGGRRRRMSQFRERAKRKLSTRGSKLILTREGIHEEYCSELRHVLCH